LIASLQVCISHGIEHLNISVNSYLLLIINSIPGVPIFFFISGYLIYSSFNKLKKTNKNLTVFYYNRFLRIYPALLGMVCLTGISLFLTNYFIQNDKSWLAYFEWVASVLSLFQFFSPASLNKFGTNHINGSLWTISVEIQFYLIFPVIFSIIKKNIYFPIFIFLIILNVLNSNLNDMQSKFGWFLYSSAIPWVWMFFFGALVSSSEKIQAMLFNFRLDYLIFIYTIQEIVVIFLDLPSGAKINPVGFLVLSSIILKLAYFPIIKQNLIRNNDISYGIYIYHMLIINTLLYLNCVGDNTLLAMVTLTVVFATLSWMFIEKPALRMKS
jgi:peptidoglycan/LPS O-acetylase OafA/YrhL